LGDYQKSGNKPKKKGGWSIKGRKKQRQNYRKLLIAREGRSHYHCLPKFKVCMNIIPAM
jgi:hypothetical protein